MIHGLATYAINWQTKDYVINAGFNQGIALTKNRALGNWFIKIPKTDFAYYAATIHRAANCYWKHATKDFGITPPNFGHPVRITCHDQTRSEEWNAVGLFWPSDRGVNQPDIEIWCKSRSTSAIFSTSCHEIGHAAHCSAVGYNVFNKIVEQTIKESWARFTQFFLTDYHYALIAWEYYLKLHNWYNWCDNENGICRTFAKPDNLNCQWWELNVNYQYANYYTPLFIDIFDDFNQRIWYNEINPSSSYDSTKVPNDNIALLDSKAIEYLAFHSPNIPQVKYNLIQYNSINNLNISNEDINKLFEIYLQIPSCF